MSTRAYIGLGSNLGEPARQIQYAIYALAVLPLSKLVSRSSLYRSPALTLPGSAPQPDYLNAVAALDTALDPQALLAALFQIEFAQGRVREQRWGARTLDLDLLLYGSLQWQSATLTLPHYALCERPFVVIPLLEIAPDLTLPDGRRLREIAEALGTSDLQRLSA